MDIIRILSLPNHDGIYPPIGLDLLWHLLIKFYDFPCRSIIHILLYLLFSHTDVTSFLNDTPPSDTVSMDTLRNSCHVSVIAFEVGVGSRGKSRTPTVIVPPHPPTAGQAAPPQTSHITPHKPLLNFPSTPHPIVFMSQSFACSSSWNGSCHRVSVFLVSILSRIEANFN